MKSISHLLKSTIQKSIQPIQSMSFATKMRGTVTKNKNDSAGRRLGLKVGNEEHVFKNDILIRQRGFKYMPGENVHYGKDHTLHASKEGTVKFTTDPWKNYKKTRIHIVEKENPNREVRPPYPFMYHPELYPELASKNMKDNPYEAAFEKLEKYEKKKEELRKIEKEEKERKEKERNEKREFAVKYDYLLSSIGIEGNTYETKENFENFKNFYLKIIKNHEFQVKNIEKSSKFDDFMNEYKERLTPMTYREDNTSRIDNIKNEILSQTETSQSNNNNKNNDIVNNTDNDIYNLNIIKNTFTSNETDNEIEEEDQKNEEIHIMNDVLYSNVYMRMSLFYRQFQLDKDKDLKTTNEIYFKSKSDNKNEEIVININEISCLTDVYYKSKEILKIQSDQDKNENEKKSQLFKYVKTMLKDSKTLNFSYKKLKDKSFKRMLREGKAEKERIYNIENMRNKAIERILSISKGENNSKSNENKEILTIYEEFYKSHQVEIGELHIKSKEEIDFLVKSRIQEIKKGSIGNDYMINRNRVLNRIKVEDGQ